MPRPSRAENRYFPKAKKLSSFVVPREQKPKLPQSEVINLPDPRPENEQRLASLLGDDRLARRIMSLQRRFPRGSVPELVVYDWLIINNVPFEYQVELFGGRRAPKGTGLLPDFLILQDASQAIVWQCQGDFWHTLQDKENADQTAYLRMIGQVYNGARIVNVVELWENKIYSARPHIFLWALAGMGMGQ